VLGLCQLRHEAQPLRHRTPRRTNASSRAALRANLVTGSGRASASGARRADPIQAPFPVSPCLTCFPSRSRPGGAAPRQTPQPFAMMPPGPAQGHIALGHSPHRAPDPNYQRRRSDEQRRWEALRPADQHREGCFEPGCWSPYGIPAWD
jgi:hypothetical protein